MPEKLPGVVSRQVAHDHPADDVAGLYAGLSDPVRRRLLREHSKVDVRLVLLELGSKLVRPACAVLVLSVPTFRLSLRQLPFSTRWRVRRAVKISECTLAKLSVRTNCR